MKYIFNQFQGLGDILFCEPIAKHFYEDGANEIIWPVNSEFLWLREYYPYINFVNTSKYDYLKESTHYGLISEDEYFIPLRFANPIVRNLHPHDYSDQYHTMLDKYRMVNLPLDLWRTMTWKRNTVKELELYSRLVADSDFILVNRWWSDGCVDIEIDNPNNNQIVEMSKVPGYSLLDWAYIIENASQIYTACTSNLFLLETLKLKAPAEKVHIYPRMPRENNLDGVMEFINKNFKLMI